MRDKCLDSELWHANAGSMVQKLPLNSMVYYFPQGHAEHTPTGVEFRALPKMPPKFLCRVASLKYLADPETDEVYVKIGLIPVGDNDDDHGCFDHGNDESKKNYTCFAKVLTQSDANNGGGFSVPRSCAETIFPNLDYKADPPVQNVFAKDVHGETWKFRHIYRGTPRRHLLTTGWSTFVNKKKLVAGDSIVFIKAENGDIFVGVRRAKRGPRCSGKESSSSLWNSFSSSSESVGRVKPESVVEAVLLAASGKPFEVVFYPLAGMPEFCVRASSVIAATKIPWAPQMRFKMTFETEDSSQISLFNGTIASVQVVDPILWPNSPWRLLQVRWDEPDLMKNVKCVNPWLVELVPNMNIPILNFTPPSKKLRLPHRQDFPIPGNPTSPFHCLSNNICIGIQGARHAQNGATNTQPDPHTNNILDENISCLLSIGTTHQTSYDDVMTPRFFLFGKPILTEQQMIHDNSSSPSMKDLPKTQFFAPDNGHCQVYLESEDVGRSLDLSVLGSYEELYEKLEHLFGIERLEMVSSLFYHDATGVLQEAGDEPFSEFIKSAKKLTIFMKANGENAERMVYTVCQLLSVDPVQQSEHD